MTSEPSWKREPVFVDRGSFMNFISATGRGPLAAFKSHDDADYAARCWNAAPELYEALQMLALDVQDYAAWQRPCAALDNARAALAKARGDVSRGASPATDPDPSATGVA